MIHYQYATIPVRISHASEEVAGLVNLDAATDPAAQGRGLFTALGQRLQAEVSSERPLLFTFPNEASARVFYNRLGWVDLGPLPVFVRPLGNMRRVDAARRAPLRALARVADALAIVGRIPGRATRLLAERAGTRVVPLDGFGGWADFLWEEARPHLATCAVRDARFLRWRFCESPFDYELYGLDRGGEPLGFAAVRYRPWKGAKIAELMELMVLPTDRRGAAFLLATVVADASARGAVALRAIVSDGHPHRRAFLRAGFVPLVGRLRERFAYGPSFGVCVLDASRVVPNRAMHIGDWYISGADLDAI